MDVRTPRCRRLCLALNFALLSLTFLLLPVCEGYKPLITPKVPDLIIKEGDPLEFTCTSKDKINIFYPEDDENKKIITSKHEIIPEKDLSGDEKVIFRRANSSYGDTGWYGCIDEKAGKVSPNYDDPNASWVYIYVNSSTRPIVESGVVFLYANDGDDVILPCRPTAPELHVDLSRLNGNLLELNEQLTFNPKEGFLMKHGSIRNSDSYTCVVNGIETGPIFSVKFVKTIKIEDPVISVEGTQHITNGSSLHLKCTIQIGIDNPHDFQWQTPRDTNIQVLRPGNSRAGQSMLSTSELIKNLVTYDDEGEYVCRVITATGITKSASVYIHIYDPYEINNINFTSDDKSRHYEIFASNSVTFSAHVNGHPTPHIVWIDPKNNLVSSSERFLVDIRYSSAVLKIKEVEVRDTGTYILKSFAGPKMEPLSFTLNVLDRPYTLLEYRRKYYALNEVVTFFARVVSNPLASVVWDYYKCPNMSSTRGCEYKRIEDSVTTQQSNIEINATATIKVDMPGTLHCTACNPYGCDSVRINIYISGGEHDSLSQDRWR